MDRKNVTERFVMLCGMDKSEASAWRALIEDACIYIEARLNKQKLSDDEKRRAELLCAAYAYRGWCQSGSGNITAFSAGEVHITSPQRKSDTAEALWQRLCAESRDLIRGGNYLFGRVMT